MKNIIEALNFLGEDAVFHHIGLATNVIDERFASQKIYDPIQRVNVAFVDLYGTTIEFIEPASPDSPVHKILERGMSAYHICFKVPNIEKAIENARKHGCACFAQPVAAAAFGGKKIAWLRSKEFGIIELLES